MFTIKPIGPWRQLRALLKRYPDRLTYVRRRLAQLIAEAFITELKSRAPRTNEYQDYLKSLTVVELTGVKAAFGVIAMRDKVKVGALLESGLSNKTVVYVEAKQTGEPYVPAEMMSSVNPWPVELLPHGLDQKQVILVHQLVTDGEYKHVRAEAMAYISENRSEFRGYGIRWNRPKGGEGAVEGMESLPDWMSLAIRSEFGINAPSMPHWRPTLKWVGRQMGVFLKKDENIQKALHDPLFSGHTVSPVSGHVAMAVKAFEKQTSAFQAKVAS